MTATGHCRDERILVLAPTTRDREVTIALLGEAGFHCEAFDQLDRLAGAIDAGAGACLLTEEALTMPGAVELVRALGSQPEWSDLPLVVLMRHNGSDGAVRVLNALPNVVLVDRPAPIRSLLSAMGAAIRARRRQYQIRDQLEQIRHTNQALFEAAEERQRLLESERLAREEAESANRAKDEFVAVLSHELRTPMAAVLGWVQILRRMKEHQPGVDDGLEVIERNARLQIRLIEDLLEMSRVIAGKIRLDLSAVDIAAVVDSAVESLRHAIDEKQLEFTKRIAFRGRMTADSERLQQILSNLLSNAVKFTPSGGRIHLGVEHRDERVSIAVSDTGIGLDAAFLPKVFDRFRQFEPATSRRAGGLGLGLGIVKHLVELHGGEVEVYSAGIGHGATFTVHLPVHLRAAMPREAPRAAGHDGLGEKLLGLRVLLVDDDADLRELVRRLLVQRGADVRTAACGAEGLEHVSRHAHDLLICDIGMPKMDGYEFLRNVHRRHPAMAEIPAVALTAFADDRHRARSRQEGFRAHLTKPIDIEELVRVIAQIGSRRDGVAAG